LAVLFSCFLLVFLSEMGDKTQLLTLVLAARFRRPWAVLAGVLCAAAASLGLAAFLGGAIAAWLGPALLRWIGAASFLAVGALLLIPEKDGDAPPSGGAGAFWTTVVTIFLAEIGDKAQLAVVLLGAHYQQPLWVALGSVLGMVAADSLAIVFGGRLTAWVPMAWIRRAASLLFILFGLALLWRG